jgi:DNA-binding FadR family transcriptional regulator
MAPEPVIAAAARAIGVRILSGALAPGYGFPDEAAHAAALGVTRPVLRAAMRLLAAKGLVERDGTGAPCVSQRRRWSVLDAELLTWQRDATPGGQFLADVLELRLMLEPGAAALAARRRTVADLAALSAALDRLGQAAPGTAAARIAEQQFHLILLEASGNEAVLAMAVSVTSHIGWTAAAIAAARGARDGVRHHRAVFDAIARGDAAAARHAMAALLRGETPCATPRDFAGGGAAATMRPGEVPDARTDAPGPGMRALQRGTAGASIMAAPTPPARWRS